jgi:serine O-acetyltransferase
MHAMQSVKQLPREIYHNFKCCQIEVPVIESSNNFLDELVRFLFPIKSNRTVTLKSLQKELRHLTFSLSELLMPLLKNDEEQVKTIVGDFFRSLPEIYRKLRLDEDSFLESDPAAKRIEEIIMTYPGFYAITAYRIAHEIYNLDIPLLPRILSEYVHGQTGIDIHPGAKIGERFFIDHGTGVVIGETAEIGNNVKIYQGVTLGAMFVEKGLSQTKRHPTIQDNVILYAGCTILGGKTIIGNNSVVGGNVWLTESVEPFSVVYHKSQVVVRDKKDFTEPVNYFI